jgi:spore germination cell wall hydrolase CwlJ-like protein
MTETKTRPLTVQLRELVPARHFIFAVAGLIALLFASGEAARIPTAEIAVAADSAKLTLNPVFAEGVGAIQLAQLSPALVQPVPVNANYDDRIVADAQPVLLLDDASEPAAVEELPKLPLDVPVATLIRAARDQHVRAEDDESRCLSEAVYFEARGEPLEGQLAVAQVILNRVKDRRFAKSVCGVVHERSPGPAKACQFSFVCAGRSAPGPSSAWNLAQAVAYVAQQPSTADVSEGALFFHTRHVSPHWRKRFAYTRTVGTHLFYR